MAMRSPVPVAVFFSSFEPSTATDAVLKVLPHLDRDRFDVRLACIDRRGPWLERAEAAAGQAIAFPVKGFHHPSAVTEARRFTRWLVAHGIAIVHAAGGRAHIFALPAAAFAGVPVRVATRTHGGPAPHPAVAALRRASYACAHRIVATSPAAAAELARENVSARRVKVIAPGIDADGVRANRPDRPLRRIALPPGLPDAQLDTVFEAMAFVAKRMRDLEVALDAKSLARGEVIQAARRHGMDGRVIAEHGWTAYRLQAADLFLHPGGARAACRHVLEAMASALPVVVARDSDAAAVVDHQRTGVLVTPGDARALAWAVLDLVQWPAHATRLGTAARTAVERHYRLDTMVSAFEQLYLDALAARRQWVVADAHVAAS
jgi:phosphatidylinositol alpha 1,6-mannosyltransferase